ncbi:MAG: hypothetical protein IPG58_01720 [Acidobacteria bacterium]|nr:hypothetical protein [Acidobacteriota bacterium]
MGPISGILTGIVLMFLRSSNKSLPLLILVVIALVLVSLDRLILKNFF